jgi:response regulator RpfG family c-di-GMP phosphodiesterase
MGLTVWIIDDDLVSQFATEYSVKQSNYEIVMKSFDRASESLKNLMKCIQTSEGIPDIILLDLVMPEMDGWEFLRQVERLVGFENKINVFIISSFSQSKDRDLAKIHPLVQGYFDKPLSKVSVAEIFQSIKVKDH